MAKQDRELAIMFADIVGSTQLYEVLGDVQAYEQIAQCLAEMTTIITDKEGEVIKTIGDEVMCQFPHADAAIKAACEIQELMSGKTNLPRLQVHIGLQYGHAVIEGKDAFGDTINVAARLVKIAGAGQIFTTEQTVNKLSPANKSMAREFDRIPVKGKQEEITIHQIIWERDTGNVTSSIPVPSLIKPTSWTLYLRYQGLEKHMTTNSPAILAGRGDQCDMVVHSPFVSRRHARFEPRRGKIILTDQSTNGTYVKTQDGAEVYLHREEFLLSGEGVISLGTPVPDQNEHLIYFKSTLDNEGFTPGNHSQYEHEP